MTALLRIERGARVLAAQVCTVEALERCADRVDEGGTRCVEEAQEREQVCTRTRDEGYSACDGWGPLALFCVVWVWVSNVVCVGWTTVARTVCVTWAWVSKWVCRATEVVFTTICRLVVGAAVTVLRRLTPSIVLSRDEPDAPSTPRRHATAMSIAPVLDETAFHDTGKRYDFRIVEGVVEVSSPGEDWRPVEPARGAGPQARSYHRRRSGQRMVPTPCFDMVAADSGRVFVKEAGRARFFVTMLDPMFRAADMQPVPSAYFKLDPQQGRRDASNADRIAHLPVLDVVHPAAVRFPLFRTMMGIDQVDSMVVNIDDNMAVWHRVDGRPPKDGEDPPSRPDLPPTEVVVAFEPTRLPFGRLLRTSKRGYRIRRVLDLGVGHEHWHEHRCSIYGGELDSLNGPGLPPVLHGPDVYRFFNGPVDDQGGFIDGTINLYVLAELGEGRFGILWLDEQAALSERWRLLDPDDSAFGGFRAVVPSSVVQYLDRVPEFDAFRFDRGRFWDPLRAGHVDGDSRMAVSRQVIVVSGRDPSTGEDELYSVHFGFGTCDRTWRRRSFPPGVGRADFDLREDMTLVVKTKGRRHFQRYLPASGAMAPDGDTLRLAADDIPTPLPPVAPAERFDHPWQTLPADVFDHMHRHFSHVGCLEEVVDWRRQFFRVELSAGEKVVRARGPGATWSPADGDLTITKPAIDWDVLNALLAGATAASLGVPGDLWTRLSAVALDMLLSRSIDQDAGDLINDLIGTPLVRSVHTHGLFTPAFRLRLLHREPLGWIAAHHDKRDDDLLPFDPTDAPIDLGDGVRIRLGGHREVLDPPAVDAARVILRAASLRVELRPVKTGAALDENLWRVTLGALTRGAAGALGGADRLLDEVRLDAPVSDVPEPGWIGLEWPVDPAALPRLREVCSEEGRQRFATSLWCEDVVGHVAAPDRVRFGTKGG